VVTHVKLNNSMCSRGCAQRFTLVASYFVISVVFIR